MLIFVFFSVKVDENYHLSSKNLFFKKKSFKDNKKTGYKLIYFANWFKKRKNESCTAQCCREKERRTHEWQWIFIYLLKNTSSRYTVSCDVHFAAEQAANYYYEMLIHTMRNVERYKKLKKKKRRQNERDTKVAFTMTVMSHFV